MAFNLELKHLKVWLCAVYEREELRLGLAGCLLERRSYDESISRNYKERKTKTMKLALQDLHIGSTFLIIAQSFRPPHSHVKLSFLRNCYMVLSGSSSL